MDLRKCFKSYSCPTQEEIRAVARETMKQLDMIRASEGDYELMISVLNQMYESGVIRGHETTGSGCMG